MTLKTCVTCNETMGTSFFSKNVRMFDGFHYTCRTCARKQGKQYYAGKGKKSKSDYYQDNKEEILVSRIKESHKPSVRWRKLRYGARQRGLAFNIDKETYFALIAQDCHYCGGLLPKGGGGLDRVNSDFGYTIDNVVPCCVNCNLMKSDLTTKEFKSHVYKIVAHDMGKLPIPIQMACHK